MKSIIKHANRRLYDASERRTITLLDVAEFVAQGKSVSVVDKVSGEDITVVTLLQSLLELLRTRSSEGLEVEEVDRLVGSLRAAMTMVTGAGEPYDAEIETGMGAGSVGGAA